MNTVATTPIEFIICDEGGFWDTEIKEVPNHIATREHHDIVKWALDEFFNDMHGVVYIGVFNDNPVTPYD